jgi:Cu2+-exporting ATPase
VWLASEEGLLASFQLAEEPRAEAAEAVRRLQSLGLAVHLLSGDSDAATEALARRLGIAAFEGGASPERKREQVQTLQRRGKRIAMVGDGVNDAPVLAQADVSLAMGSGTRLAQIQADAIVLAQDLVVLAEAIELSRAVLAVVRQNVAWAFVYNLTALPLALFGALTPWAAAIGMSGSSLLVVLNALRLQRSRPKRRARAAANRAVRERPALQGRA